MKINIVKCNRKIDDFRPFVLEIEFESDKELNKFMGLMSDCYEAEDISGYIYDKLNIYCELNKS